jgi:iron-sulfur cluster assembly accessory protein
MDAPVTANPTVTFTDPAKPTVTLSERAAKRINELMADEAVARVMRISVEGGGCSGFQYKFDLVPAAEADDVVLERSGATVVIDQVSISYIAGSEIDYVEDLMGSAFKIKNPQATQSCGCGSSFSM